jgi:chemotaxis protein MotB
MLRLRHLALLTAAAFLMNGCVAMDKYNALRLERDQLLERMSQAEAEARTERGKAKLLQDQLNAIMDKGGSYESAMKGLMEENANLKARLEDTNRKYEEALKRGPTVVLPQELNKALIDLAKQNPEIMEYDASRGMVKFKGDVTFASGSSELTPKAREVIGRFSQIINGGVAGKYDLLVAGHTDNVTVSNPRTVAAGHKDNWYLSAHRAISVASEMRKDGVAAGRLGVAGYADQHPVASNATAEGKAQNRRVEVLILPGGSGDTAPAAEKAPAAAPEVAPAVEAPAASMQNK